jgi:TatD DNase family protein
MLIDTHCHLDFPHFDNDREEVIKRSRDNKIRYLINVGSSVESSLKSKDLAEKFDNIYFSLGFHPHYADGFSEDIIGGFEKELSHNKLVAIGEVGLDYFKSRSSKDRQKQAFLKFVGLGRAKTIYTTF